MLEALLDILKISIPALAVAATAVLMMRYYTRKEYDVKRLEIKLKSQDAINPLRFHAYERMTLFLERISPQNLIPRVRESNMTAKELQIALIQNIRKEYEHNLAQQVYLSVETWDTISIVKDDIIKTINILTTALPTDASSMVLSKAILEHYISQNESMPTQRALDIIKAEVQGIFG